MELSKESADFPLSIMYYKTDNPNLGIALIFCNIEDLIESSRKIINDKKICLSKTLMEYGFEVRIYDELSYKQITKVLTMVSQEDHSKNDCFLTVFISNEDNLLISNDIYSADDLFYPFLNDECTLNNKPKLFFIDICRRNEIGYDLIFADATPFFDETKNDDIVKYMIPKTADWFIHFTTCKGYDTWYNDQTGSLLMGSLLYILDKYLKEIKDNKRKNVDVYELANSTNNKVAHNYNHSKSPQKMSLSELKMMPIYTSSLTKLFTIKPKPKT